jgi:xylulokinase
MAVLLGVDIGTASSKGVLVRPDGTLVAQAQRPHAASSPQPGWLEHDAISVWWQDFREIVGELLTDNTEPVLAIGASGIGPCLLPVDAGWEPVRPAILYGVDARATEQIAHQQATFGADAVLARCGSPLTTQAIGPKLAWLREHEPDAYTATRRWLMASSYLVHRLTGEYVLDHHSASQCVPLYDLREHRWIEPWCEQIAPGLDWPRLVWPGEVVGAVSAAAAAETGLPTGVPVIAGTIDAWAESVSVGVVGPGDVMLMYGTTMFLVDVVAGPASWPTLWGTVGALPDTFTLAGGLATSGAITGWLSDLTGVDFPTLVGEAADAGVGAGGLLMLPYFAGERTPLFDPDARGVVVGLTTRHGRGHLYRAALEATAFGVRHNLDTMAAAGGDLRRLVAVGGGTAGDLWPRIVSDVLGRPQQLPRHTIGAAYGDAFLAATAIGAAGVQDIAHWNPVAATVEPDRTTAARYDELYGLYLDLYPATRKTAHVLAHWQRAWSRSEAID